MKKIGGKFQLTGISLLLLNGIIIHKFLVFKDGRYSADELSGRIQNDITYGTALNNMLTTDCIIIDEISMLSWKIFQEKDLIFLCLAPRSAIFQLYHGDQF